MVPSSSRVGSMTIYSMVPTFRQLNPEHRPRVWINASDIFNRTPFVFSDETFGAICSDLASYPIANAVAASAAMPGNFCSCRARTFPDRCTSTMPNWAQQARRYADRSSHSEGVRQRLNPLPGRIYVLHQLLDGGLVDNYGLSASRLPDSGKYAVRSLNRKGGGECKTRYCFSLSMEVKDLPETGQRPQKVPLLPSLSGLPLIRQSI